MEELDAVFDVVAAYFSVMSEPTRLKIMHAICQDEKSVNAIVETVGATQTNVSRHLGLMYRAGVVTRRKDGNQVFYRIADPALVEICRSVCNQIASRIEDHQPLRKDLTRILPMRRKHAA
jgi:DNA-binding transcriptional ArsR family regulator